MKFTLDYVVSGPNKVDIVYCYDRQKLRKEILLKLQHIQTYMETIELSKLRRKMQDELQNPEGFSETSSDNEDESLQIKITGHLKEFNPEIQKLRQIILELNQKLHSYDEKENRRRNSIDQLTTAHIREVQALKQQIRKQSQDEENDDYIEVVYFDKTTALEPELQEMMNEKIKNIKQQYDKYIHNMMQSRQLQPHNDGPREHGVKSIDSYSARDLIKMALEKETNQYRIWKIIEEIKTYRYLLAVIINQDKSYGISYQEINDLLRCNRQEMKKITEFKNLMQDIQTQMGAQFSIQIQGLKKQILDLNKQILDISSNTKIKQSVSQLQLSLQQDQSQIIKQLYFQIEGLFKEINTQQRQISQLNLAIATQKQQFQFLQTNTINVFKAIDLNAQTLVQFNKCDIFKDKPAIITDLKKKIDSLQPEQSVLYSLYFSQLLHQTQVVQISNQIEIHQLSKETQTLPNQEEIENLVRLCQLNYQSKNSDKPQLTDNGTQTEKDNLQNNLKINKTDTTDIGRTFTMINEQIMNSQNQLPNNAFERLLGDSVTLNKRLKTIRPFIEKLSENEFSDLVHVFNTLQIKVSKEIFQLDFSNRVVDLPQQEPPRTESLRAKTLSVPQRINNSKNLIRKPNKSIDSSIINKQANEVFSNLEERREEAQQLFMSTRISSFNKRYARLIPIPLETKYSKFS